MGSRSFGFGDTEQTSMKISDVVDWQDLETIRQTLVNQSRSISRTGKVIASPTTIFWEIIEADYGWLGFTIVADDAVEAMILASLIEPT
ncbi:hypothetical protein AUR04nite_33950 [Glutamicibacter uratoxydans]|uniref:Uncharacterized protein n=1 Tax=Glutamicibacter uratoxydans TaxID=43667 RepID=A0A4Y4DT72_GLUUR|nr:hypothetical protein [Glutamicibacter uratoxydans]GED07863.1 hypothetical protein AUR04nite_33950 [Glutamicibacter uratoxydans]